MCASASVFSPNTLLIVPFSELGTKSRKTRENMMTQLLTNIKHVLKDVFGVMWTKYRTKGERLIFQFRKGDLKKASHALSFIPGILKYYQTIEGESKISSIIKRLNKITPEYGKLYVDELTGRYFNKGDEGQFIAELIQKIRNQHDIQIAPSYSFAGSNEKEKSRETEDLNISIEVHPDFTYIWNNKSEIQGLDGFPVGSQNPLLIEIMSRPSDILSALGVMMRGVVISPIYYHLGKYATDMKLFAEMMDECKKIISKYHGFPVMREFYVNLDEIFTLLFKKKKDLMENYPCITCIILRRLLSLEIINSNGMAPFLVCGASRLNFPNINKTCPVELETKEYKISDVSLHLLTPALLQSPMGVNYVNSLYNQLGIDNCRNDVEKSKTCFSWNYCGLKNDNTDLNKKNIDLEIVKKEIISCLKPRVNKFIKMSEKRW